MPVMLRQTDDYNRFNVSFHDGVNEPTVIEGYVLGEEGSYLPYNPTGDVLADQPLSNPVLAAIVVIDNYAEREIATFNRHLAKFAAERATYEPGSFKLRMLDLRIDRTHAYIKRVQAGDYV